MVVDHTPLLRPPLTKVVRRCPVIVIRREAGQTELSDDQWKIGAHETLGKDQLTKDVLVHQLNRHT